MRNPDGVPVVFLHGGPGAGCTSANRRFFDPARYRIVLFDQRGAGRSTPLASLEANTTWDLVADVERVRTLLGIERWHVFGGSWGSTLALAYAETHPHQVRSLVLRGVYLCRPWEIAWLYQEGANRIRPEAFAAYRDHIPVEERHDFVAAYRRRLLDADPEVRRLAAYRWCAWEDETSWFDTFGRPPALAAADEIALSTARIENHFFSHDSWLSGDRALLAPNNIARIADIPGVIVHGRYDLPCPVENAVELHAAWPRSELHIVANAGHAALELGTAARLVQATRRMLEF